MALHCRHCIWVTLSTPFVTGLQNASGAQAVVWARASGGARTAGALDVKGLPDS